MDPSARSRNRAICYWQSSARLGHAVAKASVMRILGGPRFHCIILFLLLSLLGTALARQILFLLQLISPTLPPSVPSHPLHSPPLLSSLLFLHCTPLFLDALLSLFSERYLPSFSFCSESHSKSFKKVLALLLQVLLQNSNYLSFG